MQPVWAALPAEVRGTFWAPERSLPWGTALDGKRDPARTVLVASYRDALMMDPSPLVLVEHGAGQTYEGRGLGNGAYPGGQGHQRVRLFLCPNQQVADLWTSTYPGSAVAVVGCPKLDRWHAERATGTVVGGPPPGLVATIGNATDGPAYSVETGSAPSDRSKDLGGIPRDPAGVPRVAVTWHWDCGLVPETRSALRHYDRTLPSIAADRRWQLLGHGHPRAWPHLAKRWGQLDVPAVPELGDVLDQADLLVGDNTSAMYEAASCGIPVLCLNAPWYRRDVEHGLRFWSHPPGLQVDQPGQLASGIVRALEDPPAARALRARAVARAYSHVDGHAAERAATAIMEACQ